MSKYEVTRTKLLSITVLWLKKIRADVQKSCRKAFKWHYAENTFMPFTVCNLPYKLDYTTYVLQPTFCFGLQLLAIATALVTYPIAMRHYINY